MNVYSDKFNCYLEGIRIPFKGISLNFQQNMFSIADVKIAFGSHIIPKMFANALVQVSYLESDFRGFKTEKYFFEGLASSLRVVETEGYITIRALSKYSSFNNNTTQDYVAPKRYGINKIDEQIKIYIGTEDVIEVENDVENFNLSERYFFLPLEFQDGSKIVADDSEESAKLQFILDRTPLAERIAFSLFENISYSNFELTQAYANRFNLLAKVGEDSVRSVESREASEKTYSESAQILGLDVERTGLYFKMYIKNVRDIQSNKGTDVDVSFDNLPKDFLDAINAMCSRLGTKADWVLAVMNFETGGTFSASKRNPTSGATGLIQFMPKYAPGDVGKTVGELAAMTRIEQLKYVEIYFDKKGKGRLNSLEDVAMTVFYPEAIGNPNFQFPPHVVRQNGGINTPKEYVRRVILNLGK